MNIDKHDWTTLWSTTLNTKWPTPWKEWWGHFHEVGRPIQLTALSLSSSADLHCSGWRTGPMCMCGSLLWLGFYYKLHQFIVELPHFIQPSGPIIDRGVLHGFQVTLLGICNFVTPSPLGWAAGHCCFDCSAPQSDCSNHMCACLLTTFNRDLVSLVGEAHWSD